MNQKMVHEILLPYKEGTPLEPCVGLGDRIVDAVEIMVRASRDCIAVMRHQRPIGMVRLDHAFEKLGLRKKSL